MSTILVYVVSSRWFPIIPFLQISCIKKYNIISEIRQYFLHFQQLPGVHLAGDVSAELTFLLAVLVDVQETIIALQETRDEDS